MKSFTVLMFGEPAARLEVSSDGSWTFEYLEAYRKKKGSPPISASLPKTLEGPLNFPEIPGFFDGLLPEGWLAERGEIFGLFIDKKEDAAAIYLKDVIGGVSLREEKEIAAYPLPKKIGHRFVHELLHKTAAELTDDYVRSFPKEEQKFVNEKLLRFAFDGLSRVLSHKKCLVCLEALDADNLRLYHKNCAYDLFGRRDDIIAGTSLQTFSRDAFSSLSSGAPLPGYQPKAQFLVANDNNGGTELILKPDVLVDLKHKNAPRGIPIFEHLTMNAAGAFGITVAKSGLIAFMDGSIGYATRRFDRLPGLQIHTEDLHQALGRNQDEAGQDKFNGDLADVAIVIRQMNSFLAVPQSAVMKQLALRTVFNLAVGNHDCHLKNHSLIYLMQKNKPFLVNLSPAYDMLPLNAMQSTRHSRREYALKINGKNQNIMPHDVLAEFRKFGAEKEASEAFEKLFAEKNNIRDIFLNKLPMFGLENLAQEIEAWMQKRMNFLVGNFARQAPREIPPLNASAFLPTTKVETPKESTKVPCRAGGTHCLGRKTLQAKVCLNCYRDGFKDALESKK